MSYKGFALFLIASTVSMNVLAGPQWQADVKVLTVETQESGNSWYCIAQIHNHWDDDARETKATILLPVAVRYIAASTSVSGGTCLVNQYTGGNGSSSYVTCELGQLGVNQLEKIKVVTTLPPASITRRECGVFAWSETPDPDRSNNYGVSP